MSKIKSKIDLDDKQQHSFRSVSRIINSVKTTEGGGFIVEVFFAIFMIANVIMKKGKMNAAYSFWQGFTKLT